MKSTGRLQKYSLRAIFFSSITKSRPPAFVNSLVYTGVGITGALAAVSGRMSVGQLTCFLSYANQYTKPFNEISGVITELQNAIACAGRVFELIEEEPQTPEPGRCEGSDGRRRKCMSSKCKICIPPGSEINRESESDGETG